MPPREAAHEEKSRHLVAKALAGSRGEDQESSGFRLTRRGARWRRGSSHAHFLSRKRRLFVNRFRNERRRTYRFWKRSEFARYLPERLLLVGPMQGRVVEPLHNGGFDDFKIRRDVEIARHVQRRISDVQYFATRLLRPCARDFGQDRVTHGVESLRDQCRADDLRGVA